MPSIAAPTRNNQKQKPCPLEDTQLQDHAREVCDNYPPLLGEPDGPEYRQEALSAREKHQVWQLT